MWKEKDSESTSGCTRPLNFSITTHLLPIVMSCCGTAPIMLAEQEETRTNMRAAMSSGDSVKHRHCHNRSDLYKPSPTKEGERNSLSLRNTSHHGTIALPLLTFKCWSLLCHQKRVQFSTVRKNTSWSLLCLVLYWQGA